MNDQSDDQLNVLIIDDEQDVRDLLMEIVHRRGHQAIAVASAEEGLELLPTWTFQLAFIDQNLPGMDGLLLGEYLRRNNPDMMIVLVTGQRDPRLERRSREMAIRFLPKPFRVGEIFDLIDEAITQKTAREEECLQREDPYHVPPIAEYVDELEEIYEMPGVPRRIESRLVHRLKELLNELRSPSRYSERARVAALAGLLTAKVLGLRLPQGPEGESLFESFDAAMEALGRRKEFSRPDESSKAKSD